MEEVEPGEESGRKRSLLRERIADLEACLARERTRCEREFVRVKERETEDSLRWLSELETAGMGETLPIACIAWIR